jgi:hypothetical protein
MSKVKPGFKRHEALPLTADPFSRRMFLQGAGSLLAIPFLPSLAYAQASTDKYFIFAATHSGRNAGQWYPTQALTPATVATGVKAQKLSTINGALGNTLGTSFDDLRDKINLIQGIDTNHSVGHTGTPYTCAGFTKSQADGNPVYDSFENSRSVDQILARSPAVYGSAPSIRSLSIAPKVGGASAHSFYGKNTQGIVQAMPAVGKSVTEVWNYVKNFMAPGAVTVPPVGSIDKALAKKKYLVDQFLNEIKSVANGSKISAADKQQLDNYTTHLFQFQQSLPAQGGGSPSSVACNQPASIMDSIDNTVMNDRIIDIMTLAMACGVTKVAMYDLNSDACWSPTGSVENLYHNEQQGTPVHTCHQAGNANSLVLSWWQYQASLFAKMVRRMGQLGLLDKSFMMFTSDISSSTQSHHSTDMPVITAGGLNGKINTGDYIDYRSATKLLDFNWSVTQGGGFVNKSMPFYGGRLMNELFQSVFAAAGVQKSEYEENGKSGYGSFTCNTRVAGECGAIQSDTNLIYYTNQYYTNTYPAAQKTGTLPYFYKG